jgi:hypothetical protein
VNGTVTEHCYEQTYMPIINITWGQIHLFLYSIEPFVFLFLANVALVVKIKSRKMVAKTTKAANTMHNDGGPTTTHGRVSVSGPSKQKSMNRVIIVTSVLFVLMTLPTATATFLFSIMVQTALGRMLLSFVDCVSLSFNAFNLFIYVLLNKVFRQEFFNLFTCFGSNRN